MNKVLVTIATDAIMPHCGDFLDNQANYASRHGYAYQIVKRAAWDHLHPSFSKVFEVDRFLRLGADYVIWADADVAFMNMGIDIADIIESKLAERPELFLAGKQQVSWLTWKYICNGLFVVRRTDDALKFMEMWIDRCLNGCPLIIPGQRTPIRDHPWEQWHFDGLIRETQYHGIYAAYAREIGAFAAEIWTDGEPFVKGMPSIHLAGPASFEKRAEIFKTIYEPQIVY